MSGALRSLALLNVGLRSTGGEVTYHLAHKLADLDERVLIVDCDLEANATESFLGERGLFDVWSNDRRGWQPTSPIEPIQLTDKLFLMPGDPRMALFEAPLAREFREQIEEAARHNECSWILVSLGVVLAPWSYAALGAVRGVALVVASQPRALRALAVAGELYRGALAVTPESAFLPSPVGYIVQRPLKKVFGLEEIYGACLAQLPAAYRRAFEVRSRALPLRPADDPYCLGLIERPAGLYELANEVGKPAFQLRPADGASESLLHAALETDLVYAGLAERLRDRYPAIAFP